MDKATISAPPCTSNRYESYTHNPTEALKRYNEKLRDLRIKKQNAWDQRLKSKYDELVLLEIEHKKTDPDITVKW